MLDLFRVGLRQLAPKGKDFGWVYIFRDLAVANYTNINSNEYFCPVGYEYKLIVTYLCTDSRCSDFALNVIQYISTIRSEQFKQDWHGLESTNDESFSRFKSDHPWVVGCTDYLNYLIIWIWVCTLLRSGVDLVNALSHSYFYSYQVLARMTFLIKIVYWQNQPTLCSERLCPVIW